MRERLQRVAYLVRNSSASLAGTVRGNRIAAYWYTQETNFGDLITPLLLREYGLTPVHAEPDRSELVSTGSILDVVPEDYAGWILGSGLIRDHRRRFPNAKVLAVRGELTRERIGAPGDVVLGDPGLLVSRLLKHREKKRYVLGIVPHYYDSGDPRVLQLESRYPDKVTAIDVMRPPLAVFSDIDECECVVSSSLHGLVAADSLGIPSAWVILSDRVVGKGFKFADYNSTFQSAHVPVTLTGAEPLRELVAVARRLPARVLDSQGGLHDAFRSLSAAVRGGAG